MLKKLIAATKKWLHRLLWGPAPTRPDQEKERAGALGEVNHIANLR